MATLDQIRARITRIDGDDVIGIADKKPAHLASFFLNGFYQYACKTPGARGDAYRKLDGDPDPDDVAHRGARGANSAVRGAAPDPSDLDLGATKRLCAAMGAYGNRAEVAPKALARLRALGCDQLADYYQKIWSDHESGILQPSDDEDLRGGDAHSDEQRAAERLASAGRAQLNAPSLAAKRRANDKRSR